MCPRARALRRRRARARGGAYGDRRSTRPRTPRRRRGRCVLSAPRACPQDRPRGSRLRRGRHRIGFGKTPNPRAAAGGYDRPPTARGFQMAKVRIGVVSAANIGRKVVIPSILRAENAELVALASSGERRLLPARDRARRPPARLLRRAARRLRGRRRLHPAPEPPARGVVEARRRCRQARAVREAGRAGRCRDGRDDRALRRPRRRLDGGVHVPLPPPVAAVRRLLDEGRSATCAGPLRLHVHGARPGEHPPAARLRRRLALRRRRLLRQRGAVAVRPPAGRGHRDSRPAPRASTRSSAASSTSAPARPR